MKNFKLIIIATIFLWSCEKIIGPDDVLSLGRRDYTGNELKLNGYYYEEYPINHFQRYVLFKNGVIRNLGSISDLNNTNILSGNSKQVWGVFQIENNQIKFERWYSSSGGPLQSYIRSGKILNDTTFQITESYRNQNGKISENRVKNEIYHFKAFSPKPDSLNSFIN